MIQRVCKWCRLPIALDMDLWVTPSLLAGHGAPYCKNAPIHSHEPVAESASTGEPPPYCPVLGCPRYYGQNVPHDHTTLKAASPSEPSAPQTSAEPIGTGTYRQTDTNSRVTHPSPQPVSGDDEAFWKFMDDNSEIVKRWPGWKRVAAGLPEVPVSGDAPKVEAWCANLEKKYGCCCGDMLNISAADLADELRPYFPPASQTPESIEAEELLAQYDEEHHDYLDGRPHQWKAWRDKVLRRLATPASTARTDGETK